MILLHFGFITGIWQQRRAAGSWRVILLKPLAADLYLSLRAFLAIPLAGTAKRCTVLRSRLGIMAVSKVLHPLKGYASSHRLVRLQLRGIAVSVLRVGLKDLVWTYWRQCSPNTH